MPTCINIGKLISETSNAVDRDMIYGAVDEKPGH
jgi:hypothetical protein